MSGAVVLILGIGGAALADESDRKNYDNRNSFNMHHQNDRSDYFGFDNSYGEDNDLTADEAYNEATGLSEQVWRMG